MTNRNEPVGSGRVGPAPKRETTDQLIERHQNGPALGDVPLGNVTHQKKIANLPPAFGTPTALTPDQANNVED